MFFDCALIVGVWRVVGCCMKFYLGPAQIASFSSMTHSGKRCDLLYRLQSFTKHLRQTLVLMWNSEIQESFNFYFSAVFASINKIFGIFFTFPNFLRSSLRKSQGNSFIPCLLLITLLRFTCGKRKIWENIKKRQNIIKTIVNITTFYCFELLSLQIFDPCKFRKT